MASLKTSLLNFIKGFGVWFLLVILNTRSGESGLNWVKIVLDIVFAIMISGGSIRNRKIALWAAVVTIVAAFLPLVFWLELIEIVIVVLSNVYFVCSVSEDGEESFQNQAPDGGHSEMFAKSEAVQWFDRNWMNPLFEVYTYSEHDGIRIKKGILKRRYANIPANNTRMRIDQTFFQRITGLCDISFMNHYTGTQFGEEILRNVRLKSAKELDKMISRRRIL